MRLQQQSQQLQSKLPTVTRVVGNYKAAIESQGFLFISGQFPYEDGALKYKGRVGQELSLDEGYYAARIAALNVLAQIAAHTSGFRRLVSIVRVEGHVASAAGFTQQPLVLDGASDLFFEFLKERAGHARTAFSHAQLPFDAPVELAVIAAVASQET